MKWDDLRSGKIKLELADVMFSRGKSEFAKGIRWASMGKDEIPTLVNHVSGVTEKKLVNGVYCYKITEALARVQENDLYGYDNGGDEVCIWRHRYMSPGAQAFVVGMVRNDIGKLYSPVRIVGQFLDKLVEKILPVRFDYFSRVWIPFTRICSVLWAVPLSYLGISFGCDPKTADPDEMLDYCLDHPEEWELVFATDWMQGKMKRG